MIDDLDGIVLMVDEVGGSEKIKDFILIIIPCL